MSDADLSQLLSNLLRTTGLGSYRAGDLLYATGPNTLAKLSAGPTTNLLHGGDQPSWAAVSMTDDVTGVLGATHGGTGQAAYLLGDLLYASSTTALSRLAGQTTTTRKFLRQTGDGVLSAAPSWDTVSAADLTDFVESAQDAVGAALTDTSEIDFTYNDAANTISATLINSSIVYARLQNATALSLLGRAANSSGVLADITASADGQVLLRNGTLAFTALTAPAAGLTISTALVFAFANDLSALEALSSTGFAVRTGTDTWAQRSIVDVANRTTITNQAGIAGNTTVDISATYVGQASITTLGTIGTGTWQGTAVGGTFGGTGLAAYTLGDTLYSSATNTLARLTGNTTTTKKFLRQTGDGSASAAPAWDTLVAGDVPDMGANPSGTIGLTAVNGTATRSYTRSDGAPALSQAITPTWTNPHTFTAISANNPGSIIVSTTQPRIQLNETDQGTDLKNWTLTGSGGNFFISAQKDDYSSSENAYVILRSGSATTVLSHTFRTNNTDRVIIDSTGISTGTWSATAIAATKGGTGITAYTLGDTIYSSAANTLLALAGNTTTTKKFYNQTGNGSVSAAPAWSALVAADIPFAAPGAIGSTTPSTGAFTTLTASTSVLCTGTTGIGYDTGAGGAVTQGTSRTTGVTLNTPVGGITLVSAAGSATFASFTLTNSKIAAKDIVVVTQQSGTDLYEIHVTNTVAGSCKITSRTTGGTTTEQPVFNFAVTKGVTS